MVFTEKQNEKYEDTIGINQNCEVGRRHEKRTKDE